MIKASFRALIEECAIRSNEEDIEGVPEWERFRVISHEAGMFLFIVAYAGRRMKIAQLDGRGGAGSSIAWLAGAAQETGGEVSAFEVNPRRLLKLQNILTKARLSPIVGVSGIDPLWGEGGGVIAPPEADEELTEIEICDVSPRFDCVIVSQTETDWAKRISYGWELLEPGGLLLVIDRLQSPDSSDDLLNEFLEKRSVASVGLNVGEGIVLAYKLAPDCPEPADSSGEHAIVGEIAAKVLDELRTENLRPGSRLWAIPPETGLFLWILLNAMKARNVLEIGSSGGYSGTWIASALGNSGGKLTTIEIDTDKISLAKETYRKAGVADWVEIIEGDARDVIDELPGDYDFIFMDCDKRYYIELIDKLVPLVKTGGLIVSDNAISHGAELKGFIDTVQHHSHLASVTVGVGSGVEVTIKL